jgi:hypothetical protein
VLGVPLEVRDLVSVPRLRSLHDADLVLVRPDQHVAWRGTTVPDPVGLIRRVVGRVDRNIAADHTSPLQEISR